MQGISPKNENLTYITYISVIKPALNVIKINFIILGTYTII